MATTTETTFNGITALTWDNQAVPWSDQLANDRSWETAYQTLSYQLAIEDTLDFTEDVPKEFTKPLSESFSITELGSREPGKEISEAFSIAESRNVLMGMFIDEALNFVDDEEKSFDKEISETFEIAEEYAREIGLNPSESLTFAEDFSRSVGFIRDFAESLTFTEDVAKVYGLKLSESFTLKDSWRRAADLVISDITFSSGDMDEIAFKLFMEYGAAPGFSKWRDFVPGDYTYREAMFRAIISSANSDRGLLTGLEVVVDVPDLIDRGSATITDAANGITITYAKNFHIIPEITLSMKGGVAGKTLVPHLVSATKTQFVVVIKDQGAANYTGSFTWAAHGY